MGEIADSIIEDGLDRWFRHLAGQCDDLCQYCWEEEKNKREEHRKRREKERRKAPKKRTSLPSKGQLPEPSRVSRQVDS
jgi:DNA gyrase/topoisomerase IV subunit B